MAARNPAVDRAALAHARAVRHGTPAEKAKTRAALAEAQIEAAIQKALADAPPLTAEQRKRLARLLTVNGAK